MASIKELLKSNKLLYELYSSYNVRFTYGYMHSKGEVARFLKKLKKNKNKIEYNYDKKDIFIIIGDKFENSTLRKAVFGDIDEGNCSLECQFYTTRQLKNLKYKMLHDLFFKINKVIPMPFKSSWENLYTTSEIKPMEEYNMFIIFMAGAYYEETFSEPKLFERIDEFAEVTFCKKILYLADPIGKYPYLYYWLPYFDIVTSYSKDDCEKYRIGYIDTPCLKFDYEMPEIKYDVYFRGMEAGRLDIIKDCYQYLTERNVRCRFYVQSIDKSIDLKGFKVSNERVAYEEMVEEELKSNVLLEVLIPGIGSGTTLRYKEAVMYGKKLLSNNPGVKEMDFGESDNIRYFETVDDIDIDWILETGAIDYNYKGQYSVDVFLRNIKEKTLEHID